LTTFYEADEQLRRLERRVRSGQSHPDELLRQRVRAGLNPRDYIRPHIDNVLEAHRNWNQPYLDNEAGDKARKEAYDAYHEARRVAKEHAERIGQPIGQLVDPPDFGSPDHVDAFTRKLSVIHGAGTYIDGTYRWGGRRPENSFNGANFNSLDDAREFQNSLNAHSSNFNARPGGAKFSVVWKNAATHDHRLESLDRAELLLNLIIEADEDIRRAYRLARIGDSDSELKLAAAQLRAGRQPEVARKFSAESHKLSRAQMREVRALMRNLDIFSQHRNFEPSQSAARVAGKRGTTSDSRMIALRTIIAARQARIKSLYPKVRELADKLGKRPDEILRPHGSKVPIVALRRVYDIQPYLHRGSKQIEVDVAKTRRDADDYHAALAFHHPDLKLTEPTEEKKMAAEAGNYHAVRSAT
jgi:hypothetical protein